MSTDQIVNDYLERLHKAASRLDRTRARELQADIEEHLREAIPPTATEAQARTELDRLGTPEEIVDAEQPTPRPTTAYPAASADDPRGIREWAAIVLLLFGGFILGVGWLGGVILLWSSRCWKTWEKWLGTLIWPGGYLSVLFLNFIATGTGSDVCTGPRFGFGSPCLRPAGPGTLHRLVEIALLALTLAAPLVVAVFLARRARTPAALR